MRSCFERLGSRGGEPEPGYVTSWEERAAAGAVYAQVRQFLEVSEGHAARLTREQKGRGVAPHPRPSGEPELGRGHRGAGADDAGGGGVAGVGSWTLPCICGANWLTFTTRSASAAP